MLSSPTLVECALATSSSGGEYPLAFSIGTVALVNCFLDIGGSWPSGQNVSTVLTDQKVVEPSV